MLQRAYWAVVHGRAAGRKNTAFARQLLNLAG